MDDEIDDALAAEIDRLLACDDLTVPGIAGRLQRLGVSTDEPSELIAMINRRKHR